jgi:hypothetical protein
MKKSLSLLCVLGCFAQPVWAANINLGTLGFSQSDFKAISEDMGSALSYKAITPPTPLGITGFDLGLEVSSTKVQNSQPWINATGSSVSNLIVPKLHIYKGLPLNFDIGAFYSAVPSTNIKVYGGELRYAILEGGVALPAVGIRGAITKLSGVSQLAFSTKSLDVSISKGFAIFTPYAGIGYVWVDSNPDVATGLKEESFRQNKVFVGGNFNFGVTNLALEYDKTGSAPTYSVKLGFRF